ncbi:hypothetical protein D3C77_514810 [compost metagenome]
MFLEQLPRTFCACGGGVGQAYVRSQSLDGVPLLRNLARRLSIVADQSLVISNQSSNLILFDHECLLQRCCFQLLLVKLCIMPAFILLALLLCCGPVMLERVPGVLVFFFQRPDLFILFLNADFQICTALADPSVTCDLSLQRGLGCLELFDLVLERKLESRDFLVGLLKLYLQCASTLLQLLALLPKHHPLMGERLITLS